jgi:hypothetical protein
VGKNNHALIRLGFRDDVFHGQGGGTHDVRPLEGLHVLDVKFL